MAYSFFSSVKLGGGREEHTQKMALLASVSTCIRKSKKISIWNFFLEERNFLLFKFVSSRACYYTYFVSNSGIPPCSNPGRRFQRHFKKCFTWGRNRLSVELSFAMQVSQSPNMNFLCIMWRIAKWGYNMNFLCIATPLWTLFSTAYESVLFLNLMAKVWVGIMSKS